MRPEPALRGVPARMLSAAALACACLAAGAEAATPPPAVAPAEPVTVTFTPFTDARGFRWDVQPNGMISDGTSDCFDNALVMQVNGQPFQSKGSKKLPGGQGYLLSGTLAGAKVTRRILLDRERGALRYLEVFENPGKTPLSLSIALHTTLGSNCQQVVTNTGTAFPGSLGKKYTGILALSNGAGGRPSAMFLLAGSRSEFKPSVSVSSSRVFVFTYRLGLKPGQTVSLVHVVAQRTAASAAKARRLFGAFCRVNRLMRAKVPEKLRPTVANFLVDGATPPDPGPLLAGVTELAEELALERGKLSVLALADGEHVSGRLSCAGLEIETVRGTAKLPLKDVALLIGGAGGGRRAQLHLRCGEILTGTVRARDLVLETGSGLEMTLNPERINVLFTPAAAADGKAPPGAAAFLRTHRGDRLALCAEKPLVLEAATAWGALRVPLAELGRLDYLSEPRPGHRLTLADGSRLSVILRGGALELASLRFGAVKVDPSEIAGILRPGAGAADGAEGALKIPHCRLVGGDLLVGRVDLPRIAVSAFSGRTVLAPDRIASMRRDEDEAGSERLQPGFSFELADGHALSGALEESVLPVRSAARLWRVPAWHLAAVVWKPRAKKPAAGSPPGAGAGTAPRPAAPAVAPAGTIFQAGTSFPAGSARPATLVPASFRHQVDALGFRWDVQSSGALNDGTNDCFDGGMVLQVNGSTFGSTRSMMTAGGREYVLTRTLGQVEVTRWIGLDPKAGGVRYVETFRNAGPAAAALRVNLISHLGGSCQKVYSDGGTADPTALGKRDSGLLAHHRPGSRPSVLFLLAGAGSKHKPQISITGRRRFIITYNLQVPPKRVVSILHIVAQRNVPGVPDAKSLAALLKPLRGRKWLRGLPADVRRSIVNIRGRGWPVRASGTPLAALESLGVARGKTDLLVFGRRTRLRGTASCAELSVQTRFGKVTVPLKAVGALAGARHSAGKPRIFLRDGRVLGGLVRARKLRFTADAGPVMDLDPAGLDRLVLQAGPRDGTPPRGAAALLETIDGDRLALLEDPKLRLPVVTPWGPLKIPLKELHSLRPHEERPGCQIRLADGSQFFAFLEEATLSVKTHSFGAVELRPAQIRSILTVRGNWGRRDEDTEEEISLPHLTLRGENVLVGRVSLPAIHLLTSGRAVPLAPSQIRSMERAPGPFTARGAAFHAELWGGDTVAGRLREAVLPVKVGQQLCRVPARDVTGIFVPVPSLSGALRTRITALVRDLGHEEWEKREAASRKLTEMGALARPLVERALRDEADPEARRRLRFLLEEMKE